VLGEGNAAARRDVVAGAEDGGRVAIKSGLEAGERVIVEGFLNMMPGRPLVTPEQMAAMMRAQGAPAGNPAAGADMKTGENK